MSLSPYSHIELAPPDHIFGVSSAFRADKRSEKYNLGVGVYQNEHGESCELKIVNKLGREIALGEQLVGYLPITGVPEFTDEARKLVFGADSKLVSSGRVVSIQAIGGTGALRIGADFMHKYLDINTVCVSTPSWSNHKSIFEAAGCQVEPYPYYSPEMRKVDFAKFCDFLNGLDEKSLVLLHTTCHNPTGADLSESQWKEVAGIFQSRNLFPYFDFAYQGFGADIEQDAFPVRHFSSLEIPLLVAQSFSKNFSLYSRRTGCFHLTTSSSTETERVLSQAKLVVRPNYSNPPRDGALIVSRILADPSYRNAWENEVTEMRERIQSMRELFVQKLNAATTAAGVDRDFSFLQDQNGMFSYSGLGPEQASKLKEDHAVYILDSGRICMAALNPSNVEYIASAIAQVLSCK